MPPEMPVCKFPGNISSMLTGIATITGSAKDHVDALNAEDTSITSAYLDDLGARIAAADKKITGTDKRQALRSASNTVKSVVKSARHELGHFRDFILRKYAEDDARRKDLLDGLGFTGHYT